MRSLRGLVVGTAGHIDHGKTSLVYALTGIETDRLKEEKQRGISIDLGFAQMALADGPTISFVDVPGHERFVRNMLAGAAGMEAVLLIVAANESVMPQTREHFEICQLLGVRHGVIVLTKCDLASAEQIARVRTDVGKLVAGSFLGDAPVVAVSALTKAGLPELQRQLAAVAVRESERDEQGIVRLPIDRSFAVKGFGTVVTGTLLSGVLKVGETLEMYPQGTKVRVRSLQSQHATVQQVSAGQRVAVNLAGIEHQAIRRGHMLLSADALAASKVVDVELRWLDPETAPSPRESLVLHMGTAEESVRVAMLSREETGARYARLRLASDIIALPGDRFVIRRPSPAQTLGGGVIIDAFPPRRLGRERSLTRLQALSPADLSKRAELVLNESAVGKTLPELVRTTGATTGQLKAAIAKNGALALSQDGRAVTRRWMEGKRQALVAWLQEFHKLNPNAAGAPLSSARMGLEAGVASLIFQDFPSIRIAGETVALAGHRVEFTQQEAMALQKMEYAFRAAGFQPPSVPEVLASSGVDAKKARSLLESLVKSNRLIRLPDELVFHAEVIAHVRTSLAQQKGRRFSVVEFKSWTNISRKFAIPLLEYLDQQRVTKREGEVRVVL